MMSRVQWHLNLGPIDYEDGGGSGETLLRGSLVKAFLDADFQFGVARTYTEPPRPMSLHQAVGP